MLSNLLFLQEECSVSTENSFKFVENHSVSCIKTYPQTFFLNVFTEFTDKNICHYSKRV